MNPGSFTALLYSHLARHGFICKVIRFTHLGEIENEINDRYRSGEFDEKFYQVECMGWDFERPASLPQAESLIVVSAPQPQIRISFSLDGTSFPVIIPPTYSYSTDKDVQRLLENLLQEKGYRLIKAAVPLKPLAVRGGMARYGRNNIAYVPGAGSLHRLAAFYTDFPCIEDDWEKPRVMDLCRTCTECVKACPTGAIADDRFLIRAERCITFHNEFAGAFPHWLDASWHDCLIGCLHCQRCCPVNKQVINRIEEREAFTDRETRLLLRGVPKDNLPEETINKLRRLNILGYLEVLPRNLRVLMEQ